MPCTPLDIQVGLFINTINWSSAPSTSFDGKTVTLTTSGANPGLLVQQGSQSLFQPKMTNHQLHYMVLGNKYLLVLDVESIAGSGTRRILLVNFNTWSWVTILTVSASSSTALPVANPSQGNGVVFLAYGLDGTQQTSVAIRRSDNGDNLCSLGTSIIATGQTTGEATATQLIIHYSTGGTSKQQKCPRPLGECQVSPSSQTFSDVAVGGCPVAPSTKQFTIKNTGNDCLTVNSIANNPPFTVQSTSQTLPASLAKNETLDVTVAFNPTSTGNWNSVELAVSTSPANGDNKLKCSGKGVPAQPKAQFNQTTFDFGIRPVGTAAPGQTLTITNNGSAPLTVSVPVLNVSGFTCAGFNGTLNCAQSQTISLGFTPPSEGSHSATLNITTNAAGSPHSIHLEGEGCVPNAEIVVPLSPPMDFGQVEQGFRTVRIFEVQNTGDAQLTFQASISGPDAALFGLPDPNGSVTDAPGNRSYTVNPVFACGGGPTGSGKTVVAVSFFANDTPRPGVSATLKLSGHNATNFPSSHTWTFPLDAEITPPVALDVGLVVDRSGSMTQSLGSRVKMDAAIAASQLFVELLRPNLDDRVTVVRFNHLPEVVVPISPVSTTTSPTQNQILQKVQNDIPPATGNTAIAAGAVTAFGQVLSPRSVTPPQLRRAVVVLSDGKDNTAFEDPAGSGQWYSILGGPKSKPLLWLDFVNTSPITVPSDINVYTIGLGKTSDIDPAELSQLASQGNFFHVDEDLAGKKYFQLEKYYTQIFMDIANLPSVLDPMYWIAPGQVHEIEFDVLRGDVKALIVLYDWQGLRLPFYCLSPRGEIIDPAAVPAGFQLRAGATSQARFVEFKMPTQKPERYAGRWKVIVEHPKRICMGMPDPKSKKLGFLPSRCKEYSQSILYGIAIGVGSNFRMTPFVTPGPVYVGDPILLSALMSEAGLPVMNCDVTVRATAPNGATQTLQLLDDGAHSDGDPNDGEYARTFTHTLVAGTYHFQFHAIGKSRDGEPVEREAVRDKAVLSRVPERPPDHDKPDASEECCRELLKEIRKQTRLLERLLKPKKSK
ncbi:MAG: choice-of-anchor D domain-containing protein [bacterium]